MTPKILSVLTLFFSFLISAVAQERLVIPYLSERLQFDGRVEEVFWDRLTPLPLVTHGPTFWEEPSERSEVYLAYDDEYFYLAGRMYVSSPDLIRGTTYKRDAFDGTSDYFGILFDSFNDKENALAFFTNPVEMRWDATVYNDAQTETSMNLDWNTFWEVKVRQTPEVWHVEMRIPLSTLRFQDRDGRVVMGLTVFRYLAAKVETAVFPDISPEWGGMSVWKPSQMQEVMLEQVRGKKPFYLAPYILAGIQENASLNDAEQVYQIDREPTFEIGGDLKYGLTSNMTLDLTVNTDFAQVEADDQQVNLTRFDLFFPEKRQFFLERSSIFDFQFDDFNRLFYSRRIGLHEGEQVRIYGGARLIGRVGNHDLGFSNMQTASIATLNSENFSVLRTRHRVMNENSYLGGILTNRMDFQGRFNTSYGFDALLRLVGDEYLTVRWAQTFGETNANQIFSLDPARIFLNWERRRYEGFNYNLTFSRAGRDYDPGVGFELREDYSSLNTKWNYGWTMANSSRLLRLQAFLWGQGFLNNESGILETGIVTTGVQFESKKAWVGNIGVFFDHEYVPEAFELTEQAGVPAGNYDFVQFTGFIQTPFTRFQSALFNFAAGSFYDGALYSIGVTPIWKISSHLEFSGFYQFNRLDFSARGQRDNTHLGRIKVQYLLNTKFSVSAFLQYNSQEEVFVANVRLRYNPREGNDFYLVFNDLINGNRERETPHLPFHDNRAVVVKYTHTFLMEAPSSSRD